MASLDLVWTHNGQVLTGPIFFAINYPGHTTESIVLKVGTNAQATKTFNTLRDVKIYLTGDVSSVQLVQQIWPLLGESFSPARPDINGGLDISFDNGQTYTRFNPIIGNETLSSTWITLPAEAIGLDGSDGTITPFDTATMLIRLVIPPVSIDYKKLSLSIGLDFDVL